MQNSVPALATLAVLVTFGPARSDPAPPIAGPGIVIADFGVYCDVVEDETMSAPGTTSGQVWLMPHPPEFVYRQQQIPARLGVSFGVSMLAPRDILDTQIKVWIPGAGKPEAWSSNTYADEPTVRGFTFDHGYELVTGIWRMEAWEGDMLLYRVEFDVLPAEALPGITSDCDLVS